MRIVTRAEQKGKNFWREGKGMKYIVKPSAFKLLVKLKHNWSTVSTTMAAVFFGTLLKLLILEERDKPESAMDRIGTE